MSSLTSKAKQTIRKVNMGKRFSIDNIMTVEKDKKAQFRERGTKIRFGIFCYGRNEASWGYLGTIF